MGQSPTKTAKTGPVKHGTNALNDEKLSHLNVHDKLFVALQRDMHIDIIHRLLNEGGKIDNPIGAKTGKTPLHVAQSIEAVKLMCTMRGIDNIDKIIDSDGNTPLHDAAKTGDLDLVLLLVEHGALPDTINHASRSPIDVAKTFMNDEIYLVLQQIQNKVCFCKEKSSDLLRKYIEEYPYFQLVEDYVTKVQTNVHLIMMEREKKEDNENESSFTFGTLQKKKNLLTTLSAEERDEKAKRERQEEAEVIKTMETSEVDGLIDLTSHKEQFKTRQLAFHYRKGKKCKYRRIKCDRCDAITTLNAIKKHYESECKDSSVACPEGCGHFFAQSHVDLHRVKCSCRKQYPCPLGCGKTLTRKYDDKQHLKIRCPMRKRRCRYCKIYLMAKDLDYHINNECVNKLTKCGVENCDAWFEGKIHRQKLEEHENEHLQKKVCEWNEYELAFWFKKTFGYFAPKELDTYCQNIVKNKIYGYLIVDSEPGKLDRLLEKQIGLKVNTRATVLQALGLGWSLKTKAGAFLSKYVANKVEKDVIEASKTKEYFYQLMKRSRTNNNKNGKLIRNVGKVASHKHNIKLI